MSADCEFADGCSSFTDWLDGHPGTGSLFKRHYCDANPPSCARYALALEWGPEHVPDDLLPNQHHRLREDGDLSVVSGSRRNSA